MSGNYLALELVGEIWIVGCVSRYPRIICNNFEFNNSDESTKAKIFEEKDLNPDMLIDSMYDLSKEYLFNLIH